MRKRSKPWLTYNSDATEREFPSFPKKKRSFRCALFWLIFGGHVGAHRFYLWDYKGARRIILLYFAVNIFALVVFAKQLGNGDDTMAIVFVVVIWLPIVVFEGTKLRGHVNDANKRHLLR